MYIFRFIRARNKNKQREIAFFFTESLIRVLFSDVTTKVTLKMAELFTEYPFLTIIAWSDERKEKNVSILQSLPLYVCLGGE